MNKEKRKSLDEFSDESELFESQFEQLAAGQSDELARARFIAETTDWLQDCAKQGRFIPLACADRRAFRSLLERWSSRLREQGFCVEGIDSLAEFDPSAGIVLTGDCPYPGLDPYTQSWRGSFFGREPLISSCLAHIEQQGNRILLIIGASGSGKSSLALAGILPRLAELHEAAWLFAPRLTPGPHPMAELASAIAQAVGQAHRARDIERDLATKPDEALGQLAALCQDRSLMLFIDQFEELLTICRDAGEQSAFTQVLCALSDSTTSSTAFCCRILLTLRTDHLARFETNNALKPLHMRLVGENNQRYLSAIGFADIKRAIKEPADEAGLRFIPATIIDQLASQTAGLSNGLPLLQFALRRLWDTRPRNECDEPLDLITEEMVKGLPDVERALGTVADGVFATFSVSQQRICERLLLELLVLDDSFEEPLRRRRNETELTQVLHARFSAPSDVGKVIDELVAAGLLRRFGENPNSQLEVAHEALLRHWDHIYALVAGAEIKERLHLIKQIGREASDWVGHDRSNDYLSLRGERLARAISYAADGWLAEAEVMAYIDACVGQDAAERLNEQRAKEEKERADAAERAREMAELRAERFRGRIWQLAGSAVLILAAVLAVGWYYAEKQSAALEVAMFESRAVTNLVLHEQQREAVYAQEAAKYALEALERNSASDAAWFYLGIAEDALGNRESAVKAFDKVSPGAMFFAYALNNSAAIYFEHLADNDTAHQRLVLATKRAPDDLSVLANYAEVLLANRHKDDAKLTAVRARTHADAQREGNAYIRAAMSFVVFSAELLSGNLSAASRELDDLERHVNSAADEAKAVAVAKGKHAHKWAYQGIRRSIEAMQDLSTRDRSVLLTVLTFVESNGQEGELEDMRRLVGSQLPKGSPLLTESALSGIH